MIDQIFKAAQVEGVANHLGSEWNGEGNAPPSIVWVPVGGALSPGRKDTNHQSREPQAIATCELTTRVRLWAVWPKATPLPEGYDQSEGDQRALWELFRLFLVRLRDVAVGTYELGDVRFLSEEGDPLAEYGKAADVDVVWSIPVTRDARQTVTVPDAAHLTMEGTMDLETDVVGSPAP